MSTLGIRSRAHRRVPRWAAAVALLSFSCSSRHPAGNDSLERLETQVQTELDARWEAAQGTDELFPGATMAFVLADGRSASVATGLSDIEARTAMAVDARMPSGSVGKMFVASVAMSMTAEGLVHLDEPASRWLGDKTYFSRLPNAEDLTLRALLNHSSGVLDHVFDAESGFQAHFRDLVQRGDAVHAQDPTELIAFAFDHEPLFEVGERFHYSDTGYLLAGLILEEASGSSYYDELARRILRPLELAETSPLDRRENVGMAAGYGPLSQQLFGLPYKVSSGEVLTFHPSIEWTGGGLITTSEDLARWAKALFEGRAIGEDLVAEMLNSIADPHPARDPAGRAHGYGLGVSITQTEHGTAYRHGGFFPGYQTMVAYFPDQGVSAAMQINADTAGLEDHFDALVRIVLERSAPPSRLGTSALERR